MGVWPASAASEETSGDAEPGAPDSDASEASETSGEDETEQEQVAAE